MKFFRIKKKPKPSDLSADSVVGLSEAGTQRASEHPEMDILFALQEQGSMSLSDLADAIEKDVPTVKRIVDRMRPFIRVRE